MMDIKVDLLEWFIIFLIKLTSGMCALSVTLATRDKFPGSDTKNENISNKELAEKLHKPVIRKFKKRKVHSPFIDNIWVADLADMQLVSKLNEGIRFLYVVLIF